jgi:hypothetical protein
MAKKKKGTVTAGQTAAAIASAATLAAGRHIIHTQTVPRAAARAANYIPFPAKTIVPSAVVGGALLAAGAAGAALTGRSIQQSNDYLARHNVKNSKEDGRFVRRR